MDDYVDLIQGFVPLLATLVVLIGILVGASRVTGKKEKLTALLEPATRRLQETNLNEDHKNWRRGMPAGPAGRRRMTSGVVGGSRIARRATWRPDPLVM